MDRRRAAGCLLALAACFAFATAAPTASNQTALDLYDGAPDGCYYNFQHYGEGDRIMTNEPCLNCTCHNRMLMCYLRVCPFTKPIGQDCTIEKRADQCCPIVTCPDVPVDLLTSTTNSPAEYGATGLGKLDKYGCSINNKYFPEGSKVPSTPNKPCEHCYCIRNMTTCVMQECTLHVDGCTPIYHKDVCCPVRYSCDHPEGETPLLDDLSTTVRPTPGFLLTTTTLSPVTQISQDCVYDNQIFPDGALIKTEKACDHCYCMKGDIVCVVQECGTPMENEGKNCTAIPPREGVCCPDTYICEGDEPTTGSYDGIELTTNLPQETLTTLSPPRRTGSEGSGYRNEDTTPYTETPLKEIVEGSGDDEGFTDSTRPSDNLGSSYETEEPHEYISVTTKQPLVQPEITTRAYIEPDTIKLTTDKLQDQELGSGEEERDQDKIPDISPATTISTVQEETTVPYVHDIVQTKVTEEPESQVTTSTIIPDRKEDTTIVPQEDITSSKDKFETSNASSQKTTVSAIDEDMVPHVSTIVPIAEDVDRKATQSEQSTLASITKYESQEITKPGVEDEISTEIQEIVTERSEKPEIQQPHPTVTASTPMLEEIEKETTEFSEKEPTSSEIVIPAVDSEFSTSRPSDEDHTKLTDTSEKIDDDISDYITTISTTFETDYITTPEPEKQADLDDHTPINVTPIADAIDKEASPSDKPTELFEEKTEYYAPSTTSASQIDQSQLTTTEPNKELNTIPGVEEHSREPSELEKTTISDSDEESPLVNKFNDSPNVPTSVTLAPADESSSASTTEMKEEVEAHKVTETITTSSDKFDEFTLSPTTDEKIQTESPLFEEQTSKLDEITLKPTDESTSGPDYAQTDQINLATTSSYGKFPETTMANINENEIFNEPRIPGEGDCLLNGVTYRNESSVPSTNKCLSDCKCMSSIVKCDPIICSPPPEYMENCRTMYDPTDSCCPTYICDHKSETMPPQPHSQMSGTESPAVPSIQCNGDECKVSGVDKQGEDSSKPCASGICPSQTDKNLEGVVSEPVTKPPIKSCEGDECKSTFDETSPDLQPQLCAGLDCNIPVKEYEPPKESCQGDGECKKQEEEPLTVECKDDSCRRKDSPVIDQQISVQCSGSECSQIDTSASPECKDENCQPKDTPGTDQQIPEQCSGSECQQTDIESTTSIVSKPITPSPESSVDSENPEYSTNKPLEEIDSTSSPTDYSKLPDVTSDKLDEIISTTVKWEQPQDSATTKIGDEETISSTELPHEKIQESETTKIFNEIATELSVTKVDSTTNAGEFIETEPSISDSDRVTETSGLDITKLSEMDGLKTTVIPDIQTTSDTIDIEKEPSPITEITPVEEEKKGQSETQPEETHTKSPETSVEGFTSTSIIKDETSGFEKPSESTEGMNEMSTESYKPEGERTTLVIDENKIKEILTTEATKTTDLMAEATLSPLDQTTREKITVETEVGTDSPRPSGIESGVSSIPTQVTDEESVTVATKVENVTPARSDEVSEPGEVSSASESGDDVESATEENIDSTKSQQEIAYSTTPTIIDQDKITDVFDKEPQEDITVHDGSDSESTIKPQSDKEPSDVTVASDLDANTIKLDESTIKQSDDVTTPISDEKDKTVTEKIVPPSVETEKPSTIVEPIEKDTTESPDFEPEKSTPSEIISQKPVDILVPTTEVYDLVSKFTLATDNDVTEFEHVETEITSKSPDVIEDITTVTKSDDKEPEKDVTIVYHDIERTGETSTVSSNIDNITTVTSTYDDVNKETTQTVEDKIQDATPTSVEDVRTAAPVEITEEPQKPDEIESSSVKDVEEPATQITQTFESESEKAPSSPEPSEEATTKSSIEDMIKPSEQTEVEIHEETISPVLDTNTESTIKTSEQVNMEGTEIQDLVTESVTVPADFERKPEEQTTEPSTSLDMTKATKPQEIVTTVSDEQFEVTTKPTEIKLSSVSDETDIVQATTPTSKPEIDLSTSPETSKDEPAVQVTEKLDIEFEKSTTPSEIDKESDITATTLPKIDEIVPDKIPVSPQDIETGTNVDVDVGLVTEAYKPEDKTPYEATTIVGGDEGKDSTTISPIKKESTETPTQEEDGNGDVTTPPRTAESESKPTEATYIHDKDAENIPEIVTSNKSPDSQTSTISQDFETTSELTELASSELPQETQTGSYPPLETVTDKIQDIDQSEISTKSSDIPYYTERIPSSSESIEPVDKTTKSPESEISQEMTNSNVEVTKGPAEDTTEQVTESDLTESSTKGLEEPIEPEPSATSPKPELISETTEVEPAVTTSDGKLEKPDVEIPTVNQPDIVEASTLKPEVPTTIAEEYLTTSRIFEGPSTTAPVEEPSVSPDVIVETTPEVQSIPVSVDTASDKTITTVVPISEQTENIPDLSEKPLQEHSQDTTAPEEEHKLSTTQATPTKTEAEIGTTSPADKFTKPEEMSVGLEATPTPEQPKPISSDVQPTDELPPPEEEAQFPPSGPNGYGDQDYMEEDQTFGPGTCRYGGKVYVSAQQIPRDDPCDFCFCFRSDIICLQQSCPPPIHGCHEEPIQGFCCPRYECPVSMATTVNVTTTTTTTTTTLPPHFPIHSYKGSAQRKGCLIKGQSYKVGDVVRSSSGPCLHCTCGGDGQMKCDPKACTPEPMLRQMIAAAVSAKRRR